MRKFLLVIVAAFTLGAGVSFAPTASADRLHVDLRVVYRDLSPYGHWVQRHRHGWVWVPRGVPVNWRPYTHGHWAYTDDYGWLWVSDWAWGWAPFHYGRWVYDDDYGWVWLPGTEWAPAWVAWRYGDGWVGWAPLPPDAAWHPSSGFSISITLIERHIRPTTWVFVPEREFIRPHIVRYSVLPARNVVLFGRTRNTTRYRYRNNRIANHSLNVQQVERAARRPVIRHQVQDVDSPRLRRAPTPTRREIPVYRPQVMAGPRGAAPPPAVRRPQSPEQIRQREQLERRQMIERQRQEQRQVQQRYRRELQRRPPPQTTRRLRRDEREEVRTLDREHQRERNLLERRYRREHREAAQGRQRQQQRQAPRQRQGREPQRRDQRDGR
jgi:hypothetical protein